MIIQIKNNKFIKRLDGVDLLRGLAIFFVLMNHVNMRLFLAKLPYTAGIPDWLVSAFVWNGQFGVQIFFAISGFLITLSILQRWGSLAQIELRSFYLFRFARIAPLMLLLLAVLSILHLAQFKDFIVSPKVGGLSNALFAALTFHINVLEARRGYLPGNWDILWSLSVEEVFYLFFPLFCYFFGRGKLLLMILFTFVLMGPFARTVFAYNDVWLEYSYLGCMDAIALGCLTAMIVKHMRFSTMMLRVFFCSGAAILILILTHLVNIQWLQHIGLDMTLLAIGTCMLIITAAQTEWKSPSLLNPLRMIGQCSYEIYLTHMFVVYAFFNLFVSLGKPMILVPVLFAAIIIIASVLGDVVAHYYSEPLNTLLRNRAMLRAMPNDNNAQSTSGYL